MHKYYYLNNKSYIDHDHAPQTRVREQIRKINGGVHRQRLGHAKKITRFQALIGVAQKEQLHLINRHITVNIIRSCIQTITIIDIQL